MRALSVYAYPTPVDVDGSLHRWPVTAAEPNVYFELSTSDESLLSFLQDVMEQSSEIWSGVDRSLIKILPADKEHPAQITVYYEESIIGGDAAAGYSVFDDVTNGVPNHCSIHIALSNTDTEALSKTTLHELGHCLGLAHSLMADSIMSYNLERNRFALAIDDEAAISRLYPSDGSDPKLAPGCAIGTTSPSARHWPVFIALFMVPWGFYVSQNILRQFLRI
jgi:hypothetical protein